MGLLHNRVASLALGVLFAVVSPASATDYYVDPTGGNDANAGTSTGAAWKTLPGTLNTAGTDYLNAAWGSITTSAKVQPGDTIYLKAGETQSSGQVWICDGTEAGGSRCIPAGNVHPGFYANASSGNPIKIEVSSSWGSGDFTFDFGNVTGWYGTNMAAIVVKSDYVWLRGISTTQRINITTVDVANAKWMLQFIGRTDLNDYVTGSMARFLDLDGTNNGTVEASGIDVSTAENFIIANTLVHDLYNSGGSSTVTGITVGGFNDNHTDHGMIVDNEVYDLPSDGYGSFAADNLKYLRSKAHDVTGGSSKRGFNAGAINGPSTSNVSWFECEAWDNSNYAFGFSACGQTECECPADERMVIVNFIGYSRAGVASRHTALLYSGVHGLLHNAVLFNGTGGAFLMQTTHRRGSCTGCGTSPSCCTGDTGNCAIDQDCIDQGQSTPCVDEPIPETRLTAKNVIFYPDGNNGIECSEAGTSLSDNAPVTITSDYNIWVPQDGGADTDTWGRSTNAGGCDAADFDYTGNPDWDGANDLVGVANRPAFVATDHTTYESNDFRLQAGSTGIDAGTWYCTITSATGSGATFNVDCDPNEFFYDADNYPGNFLDDDVAYIGIGTGTACAVASLSTSVVGVSGSITCTGSVSWTNGDGVSRQPVYGSAPDIGRYEFDPVVGTAIGVDLIGVSF